MASALQNITDVFLDRYVAAVRRYPPSLCTIVPSCRVLLFLTLSFRIVLCTPYHGCHYRTTNLSRSDRDESASLDEKEIRVLSFRLAQLDGVTVRKELLEEKLREDASLAGVMAILQASTKDSVAHDDKVFIFEDETP